MGPDRLREAVRELHVVVEALQPCNATGRGLGHQQLQAPVTQKIAAANIGRRVRPAVGQQDAVGGGLRGGSRDDGCHGCGGYCCGGWRHCGHWGTCRGRLVLTTSDHHKSHEGQDYCQAQAGLHVIWICSNAHATPPPATVPSKCLVGLRNQGCERNRPPAIGKWPVSLVFSIEKKEALG